MIKTMTITVLTLLSALASAAAAPDPKLDAKTAAELRQRVDTGDGDAALRLGNLLARGRIPAEKYGKAVDWYKKGCALRSVSACHNAGVSYHFGRNGAKPSHNEAANYYLQGADRAFLYSMFNLAMLHAEGRITTLDNGEGLKWLLVAQRAAAQCPDNPVCKSVLEDRKGYRAILEPRLTPEEQRKARQQADAWQPLP